MDDRIDDGRIMAKNRLKELKKGEFFAEERIENMKEWMKI